jgi:uncharacterized protein (TIGR00369 family)
MIAFQPGAEDFDARVRSGFDRQRVMRTIGAELTRVSPGIVEIEMAFDARLTQQHGFIHAGIVSTLLDSACGFAAFTLMPAGASVLTIEFKVNLLAPAEGERFLFRGEVTKPGRTILVADGRAYAFQEDGPRLIASMTGTLMSVIGRDEFED